VKLTLPAARGARCATTQRAAVHGRLVAGRRRARARARQVNIAGRAAAISPGSADTLAAFAGVYASFQLPDVPGKPADAGFELSITVNAQGARPGPGAARMRVHGPAAALARPFTWSSKSRHAPECSATCVDRAPVPVQARSDAGLGLQTAWRCRPCAVKVLAQSRALPASCMCSLAATRVVSATGAPSVQGARC